MRYRLLFLGLFLFVGCVPILQQGDVQNSPLVDIESKLDDTERSVNDQNTQVQEEFTSDFTPPDGGTDGPGERGPWNHRLMVAYSDDSLNFERANVVVANQADVPDLAIDEKGRVYLYYTGWTVGRFNNQTVVAISDDAGGSWAYKYLNVSGLEKNIIPPVDPDIHILEDGTFRLYGTSDPHDGDGPRTYYFEGLNGIDFELKGVAFADDEGRAVLDPSAIQIGDTWHLFAGGVQGANWHATSSDGVNYEFLRIEDFMADGHKHLFANGIRVGEEYRFYAFEQNADEIVSFTSTDGDTWTKDEGTRLQLDTSAGLESNVVKDPGVIQLQDGRYLMVYATMIP